MKLRKTRGRTPMAIVINDDLECGWLEILGETGIALWPSEQMEKVYEEKND